MMKIKAERMAELKRINIKSDNWDPANKFLKRLSKRRFRAWSRDKLKGDAKREQTD